MTVGGFNSLRLVGPEPPRPFDRSRAGMAVGEGAAFLVLESPGRARARGARPLATLDGWGLSADAHHATAPHPEGTGALEAMRAALRGAGATAAEVDAVNAHGTGTRANDAAEAAALVRLLGDRAAAVPVSSVKGAVGHCLGAAGALESVVSVLTLARQTVPPTAGLREPEFKALLLPREPLSRPIGSVLSVNLAFGGHNAALFFRRAP
jgi:3-oxoacyl-[acyl-carrier-protein] synthase II